jgi:hypothetical protein
VQWVLSADILATANWPLLAVTALRNAESASPATVKSTSVQYLAGVVAAESGERRIFQNVGIPKIDVAPPRPALLKAQLSTSLGASLEQLAVNLQTVPSLKHYGLSLEGDILRAKGDNSAALTAYKASAAIVPSPSISGRITTIESVGERRPGRVDVKAPKKPSTNTLILKPEAKREGLIRIIPQNSNQQ